MAKVQEVSGKVVLGALAVVLAACAPEVILPGERFDPRTPLEASVPTDDNPIPVQGATGPENQSVAISLPGAQSLSGWTQRGGSVRHDSPHGVLSAAPALVWAVSVGAGNNRQNRIAAAPVVADGRVFALDTATGLTAVAASGAAVWHTDLAPEFDSNSLISGGGLSVDGPSVFATTGYGEVVALDVGTGAIRWRQRLDSVASGAPLAAGGAVYLTSRDGSAWALSQSDGRILWTVPGLPATTGVLGAAAPTLGGDKVFFPFTSGEIGAIGLDGTPVWVGAVAGQRAGRAYANLGDLTGDPVLVGDTLYLGTASGTTAALNTTTGQRIWTAPEGAMNPPLVVGGSVFVVNDESRLVRLDAGTGQLIWAVQMPYFVKEEPKKRKGIVAHYGPVLAGGRIAVASGDGLLRLFDATDGTMVATAEVPGGAASAPALAGGMLFVVGGNGQLLAFR